MRIFLIALFVLTAQPALADDARYKMHSADGRTFLLYSQTGKTWIMRASKWEAVPFAVEAADGGPTVPGGKAARESRLNRWEKDGHRRRMPAAIGGKNDTIEEMEEEAEKEEKRKEGLKVLQKIIR